VTPLDRSYLALEAQAPLPLDSLLARAGLDRLVITKALNDISYYFTILFCTKPVFTLLLKEPLFFITKAGLYLTIT
jgi:hypothetical protein